MAGNEIPGLAGPKSSRTATPRTILHVTQGEIPAALPLIIDGSKSRDYGNGTDYDVIRAGTFLTKVSGSDKYLPWVLAATTVAYTTGDSGTDITVGIGGATAIQKFLGGSTGTLYFTGAPTAGGTINNSGDGYESKAITGLSTTLGTITLASDLAGNLVVGSLIHPYADGSGEPLCILADEYGVAVTDRDDTDLDAPANTIVQGMLKTANLVGWPASTYTALLNWLRQGTDAQRPELLINMPGLLFDDRL